jgi:hypothetical protein
MNRPTALLALAAALAITGCNDPYTSHSAQRQPTPTRTAPPARSDTAEPGPAAPATTPAVAQRSRAARSAARSFATRWINWDWRTAASQQRALAKLATGALARILRANASSARIDATLARDKPGSRGTVTAIELKRTQAGAAGIVVTHEQTYTGGHADLGGQRYHVYLVQLHRAPHAWEVRRWAPQP